MAKATVHKIFNQLVETKQLQIKTLSTAAHESLRSRLCKLFSKHKTVLTDLGLGDGTESLSICASFENGTGVSTFRIAPRKQEAPIEFEILESLGVEGEGA